MENKFNRVVQSDPSRCKATLDCPYQAVPGSDYCPRHGGNKAVEAQRKQGLRNYRLQQYGERVGELSNSTEIKSLREEIGITRMLLEKTLNHLTSVNQLLIHSPQITSMVGQIQRLVEASQKMEERNNQLLDRKVLLIVVDAIVTIIGDYITDPDKLNEIGEKICECITAIGDGQSLPRRVVAEGSNGTVAMGV